MCVCVFFFFKFTFLDLLCQKFEKTNKQTNKTKQNKTLNEVKKVFPDMCLYMISSNLGNSNSFFSLKLAYFEKNWSQKKSIFFVCKI